MKIGEGEELCSGSIMMKKETHGFVGECFAGLLYLYVIVLLATVLCVAMGLVYGFLIPEHAGTNLRNLENGLAGVVFEILIITVMGFRKGYRYRYVSMKNVLLSFAVPIPFHFLIAWLTHFAVYTAGPGVTYLGIYFYHKGLTGNGAYERVSFTEIPKTDFVVFLIVTDVLLLAFLALGNFLGKRKRNRETEKFLRQENAEREERGQK